MTRPLLLSNGALHVGINLYGMVHDLYFPHVGMENHAAAQHMRHRIGVWIDSKFSWLDDGDWHFAMAYDPLGMVGHTTARHDRLQVTLEFTDFVDSEWNTFLRSIKVTNGAQNEREIRLFLHQMLLISNSLNRDTAQFLPDQQAILHYKGQRAFVVGGQDANGNAFNQFSIGLFGMENQEGVFRDAEDGVLQGKPVEFGQVDSIFGFTLRLKAAESTKVRYWLCAARSQPEAIALHETLKKINIEDRLTRTLAFWQRWLAPANTYIAKLPEQWQTPFRNSLLLVKAAIDHKGGVVASTDTTMLNYIRDVYTYCWPRDSVYALLPLLRMGYKTELKNFFAFSRQGLHPDGFLHPKYQSDGAIGSSWHPYVAQGRVIPPIQEDETAIVAYAFCQYMQMHRDQKVFDEFYDSLLAPMCNFMASYIDPQTKLPYATYDLWEIKFLTSTYTVAVVYAALSQAAELAAKYKRHADAVHWQTVADDIKMAAPRLLYRPGIKYFCKGFINRGNNQLEYDDTIDGSSVSGAALFGLFGIDSPEYKASLQTYQSLYNVAANEPTISGRWATDDYYHVAGAKQGNPWFVTSLWLAQLDILGGNIGRATKTITWATEHMLSTGVLPEQYDQQTQKFISVAPLTWSQAAFMSAALDALVYSEKPVKS